MCVRGCNGTWPEAVPLTLPRAGTVSSRPGPSPSGVRRAGRRPWRGRRPRRRQSQHPGRGREDLAGLGLGALEREALQLVSDLDDPAGVHDSSRGRRGCRASASRASMPGWASWLLAPPQTSRADSAATTSSVSAAPARTASRCPGRRAPARRCPRPPRPRRAPGGRRRPPPADTSVTTTVAPSSTRWSARCRPTLPTPAMPTVRPARVGDTPEVLGAGPHALEHAVRREDRRVAGAAVLRRAPGRVPGGPRHHVHVRHVGADVAGGDVAAAEHVDEPAVGQQQALGLVHRRVADDHRLAAAVVEPGERVLVGHRPGQLEHVASAACSAAYG